MKTKQIIIAIMLAVIPFWSFAQEWDDIYATPSQNKGKTTKSDSQKKKVVIVEGKGTDIKIQTEARDIDEYNRRGSDALAEGDISQDSLYQDYEYTDRIIKYHDPENSIKISGVDEVTVVYVDGDVYSDYYRNRGYYGSMYYPWYTYDYMYDPWFYGCYGYNSYYYGWYNPWFSPWSYSFYFNPWYYGSWHYSPYWYYSSYWYYGGGGYYNGFYDGYYSALTSNRSGRSNGTFRTSSVNTSRLSTSGRTSASARTSSSTSRISSHSSRDVSSYRRSDANSGRTRIVDNSGRVVDSRTGRVLNRDSNSRPRPGNYNNSTTTSRPTSTYQRDAVQRRINSSPSSLERATTTRSYDNRSSSSYENRSSRNSSFSNPSSMNGSSRSSSFGSSSSSSSRSSSSSGRVSSGRRN